MVSRWGAPFHYCSIGRWTVRPPPAVDRRFKGGERGTGGAPAYAHSAAHSLRTLGPFDHRRYGISSKPAGPNLPPNASPPELAILSVQVEKGGLDDERPAALLTRAAAFETPRRQSGTGVPKTLSDAEQHAAAPLIREL